MQLKMVTVGKGSPRLAHARMIALLPSFTNTTCPSKTCTVQADEGELDINGRPNYKGGVLWVCKACLMGIHDTHSSAVELQQSAMKGFGEVSATSHH